jgi:hypothetical protein
MLSLWVNVDVISAVNVEAVSEVSEVLTTSFVRIYVCKMASHLKMDVLFTSETSEVSSIFIKCNKLTQY